jgi:hypothetical protein
MNLTHIRHRYKKILGVSLLFRSKEGLQKIMSEGDYT